MSLVLLVHWCIIFNGSNLGGCIAGKCKHAAGGTLSMVPSDLNFERLEHEKQMLSYINGSRVAAGVCLTSSNC